MESGHLLSDIPAADVDQLHREPQDWKWQTHNEPFEFIVDKPEKAGKRVALYLSLSAAIDNSRINTAIGSDIPIWRLTSAPVAPNNDVLKSREQLALFRQNFRTLLDEIKYVHGQDAELHVFPAVPVAMALEMGRIRMPKADLSLHVYDQHNGSGFQFALSVG
jgi:SMODS-associated and fused to various effectors sensor domain